MRLRDVLNLSLRSFRTRPMRTALTILGMGVGIGAVLFLVSFGYGLQRVILNQITTADSLLSLDVGPGNSGLIELNQESVAKMAVIPHVSEVSPVINEPGQLTMGDMTSDSLIFGVDQSFLRLNGVTVEWGKGIEDKDTQGVVVSAIGAKLFNYENPQDILGKEIKISVFLSKITEQGVEEVELKNIETPFKVVGVINDESLNYIYVPRHSLDPLAITNYAQAKVKVDSSNFVEEVRGKIIEQGYVVSALSDTIDQAKKIFNIVQIVLGLFGLIALVVSAIGMFNTMTITLLERINEIGIMRSIGITSGDIQKLFLVESMLIGFLGGISGIIIGLIGGEIVNFIINLLAQSFGGKVLDLFYSPAWFMLFIVIFSSVIGLVTGIYPSKRAGSLNPLEALRYK